MKQFIDTTGRTWQIDVNVGAIERVKAIAGVDLTKLFDDQLKNLAALYDDPAKLAAVLWVLCGNGTDREAFYNALRGDALEEAASALIEDVIDFFPNRRRRELARTAVRKIWETVNATQDQAAINLQAIEPQSLISATSSPESSA